MENAWDAPTCHPNRPGDLDESLLERALGAATSRWERVEAELGGVFAALKSRNSKLEEMEKAFSRARNVHQRADLVGEEAENIFRSNPVPDDIKADIIAALTAYLKWAERRNEVAHGDITPADGPDYAHPDQPIITTFSLCPSHRRSKLWINSQPVFNYNAAEINAFAAGFEALSVQFEKIRHRLHELTD